MERENKNPRVTVLMPVYNGEDYLKDAIESILSQTFKNFEFLIINDGSTDRSLEIIESFKDSRIRLVQNKKNLKLIATLNKGLALSRGEYIARMDCDDISLPERLEKQVDFMDANSEVGISGTWIKTLGKEPQEVWRFPSAPDEIAAGLLFKSSLAHPSVIMRKESLSKNNLQYSQNYPHAEDYELWFRASRIFPLMNLQEVLVLYRIRPQSTTHQNRELQAKTLEAIHSTMLSKLGIVPKTMDVKIHRRLGGYLFDKNLAFVRQAEIWLSRIIDANESNNVYSPPVLKKTIARRWFLLCSASTGLGLGVWKIYSASPVRDDSILSSGEKLKFFTKCLLSFGGKNG